MFGGMTSPWPLRCRFNESGYPAFDTPTICGKLSSHDLPNRNFREDSRLNLSAKLLNLLVGAAGFEPTTCSTQNCRATRLRYTPMSRSTSITRFNHHQQEASVPLGWRSDKLSAGSFELFSEHASF
jgi:hypothetical protein